MKRHVSAWTAIAFLAGRAPAAIAQVSASEIIGLRGVSVSTAVRHGRVFSRRTVTTNRFGRRCVTVSRSVREYGGVRQSSARRCN